MTESITMRCPGVTFSQASVFSPILEDDLKAIFVKAASSANVKMVRQKAVYEGDSSQQRSGSSEVER